MMEGGESGHGDHGLELIDVAPMSFEDRMKGEKMTI
jgi:hypothetical protein